MSSCIGESRLPRLSDEPLTEEELRIAVVCMMAQTSFNYKNNCGITSVDNGEQFDYVIEHPESHNRIIREFIRHQARGHCSDGSYQKALDAITRIWSPDGHQEVTEKFDKDDEKKLSKIAKQLADLGYDTNGKKLEG